MKTSHILSVVMSTLVLSASSLAQAQTTKPPLESARMAAFMDRDAFLSMHRWDEMTGMWVVKSDIEMPKGIKSRSEVMAMTEVFLSKNRWDESGSQWVPIAGAPRDMGKLTREQVRMDTARFLMSHYFDESSGEWLMKLRPTN